MYNKYFKITRWFKLGFYGECLISNQDLFSNYTATILRTPAFEPIPEMKTLFLAKYRALDYFGLGIQPVFILFKNFDLRAEGYIFQPYEELEQGEQQQAVKAEPWSDRAYILSGSLVYHMRLTPISLSFNYYNKGEDKFSVMFNIGFIIFNKSVL
jgi:NTE family protein